MSTLDRILDFLTRFHLFTLMWVGIAGWAVVSLPTWPQRAFTAALALTQAWLSYVTHCTHRRERVRRWEVEEQCADLRTQVAELQRVELVCRDEYEEAIEQAYWEFDAARKSGSCSERDAFKGQVRSILYNPLLVAVAQGGKVF